ncbi:MAG: 30S ribosomal protein S9 [Candidatus Yanofskybacteria bacterium CG10_big_fil_rev_8_21_14_0_10_37_15]|uniref:Small ribosomal subunit protein uS9 n=1 Tax=Candidatus Yanofskybacteria bacterium CG10_big_fil_rev_8_21_14_0_10_37_15 TaxID=1975097 RepID=A0A2H0R5D3_9BACT|nr:MAG: 30S ribosomal protein S9 [Candidatus Yanofskybacteria bacterium CG10_big_fil_rev_8_21_14_0_10_37_15]
MATIKKTKKKPAKKELKKATNVAEIKEETKEPIKSVSVEPEEEGKTGGKEKYFYAIGRRKESVARVRLFTKKSSDLPVEKQISDEEGRALINVNNKLYTQYFSDVNLQNIVESPLKKLKSLNRFKATVLVKGGGSRGQADAVKHGIARALVLFDINFRKKLKKSGLLTRDPRVKERRKYGHKKARKSGQFSKR